MSAVGRPYQVSTIGSFVARLSQWPARGRNALIETVGQAPIPPDAGSTMSVRWETHRRISSPAATLAR